MSTDNLVYRRGGKQSPITEIGIVAIDKKDPEKVHSYSD